MAQRHRLIQCDIIQKCKTISTKILTGPFRFFILLLKTKRRGVKCEHVSCKILPDITLYKVDAVDVSHTRSQPVFQISLINYLLS